VPHEAIRSLDRHFRCPSGAHWAESEVENQLHETSEIPIPLEVKLPYLSSHGC